MCFATHVGPCSNLERGDDLKYFDDPVHNSKFNQFIDLLAELIEKYGGDIEFPETEKDNSWENNPDTIH